MADRAFGMAEWVGFSVRRTKSETGGVRVSSHRRRGENGRELEAVPGGAKCPCATRLTLLLENSRHARMNTRTLLLGAIASVAALPLIRAASIDRATITEVVNSVSVIEPASKRTSAARREQLFTAPNVLRTGADSRAEMVSPDQTVTRV